jgi:hypothetical protein
MAGFEFAYSLDQSTPVLRDQTVADTVVLTAGTIVNLETGELTIGVTADTALYGVTTEDCDNTDDGLSCQVITNKNAVYRVADANARLAGATLDIGAGGKTVAASSNADLIVVEDSTASEDTLVTFAGSHFLQL